MPIWVGFFVAFLLIFLLFLKVQSQFNTYFVLIFHRLLNDKTQMLYQNNKIPALLGFLNVKKCVHDQKCHDAITSCIDLIRGVLRYS